jgi:hypothetical protein
MEYMVQQSALDARNLKYTTMHQQYYLVQPANAQEMLISPSE